MDYHRQCISSLCRFCGERVIKGKGREGHAYIVANYEQKIQSKLNIDISQDLPDVHPTFFCTKCYCQIMTPDNKHKIWAPKNDWCDHKRNADCETCMLFQNSVRPGRPQKRKSGGRPPMKPANPNSHFCAMYDLESWPREKCKLDRSSFQVDASKAFLICSLCDCVVSSPIETPCNHLFCVDCLSSKFCKVSVDCPLCNLSVHYTQTRKPATYIFTLLDNLHLQCTQCHSSIHHTKTSQHTCHQHDHTYSKMPDAITSPRQRQEIATAYLREQLDNSEDGISATFGIPGHGKPIKTTRIPAASVSSQDCSRRTVRRRTQVLERLRRDIAKNEGIEVQHKDEVENAGLKDILGSNGIMIPTGDILQLKSFFNLSWRTLRRLKRWLKTRNIHTGHEGGVKALEEEIIGDNIRGALVPLQAMSELTKSLHIKEAPLIQVCSLRDLVFNLLDQYDNLHELTWHRGNIPEDEVWLKIGGDKGGGTFKMMVQLANLERPNSLSNTRVVLLYPGTDTAYNLEVALQSFAPQIDELSKSTWRGKKVRLFAFGDYEFIMRMYGLTGPNGRHCCLFCHISKQDMASNPMRRAAIRPRTLQTLLTSLELFREHGIPKEADNVVRQPFFEIPIDHVCPPGLHMSLGIHYKHYISLSKACHLLDLRIAQHLAKTKVELEAAHEIFKQQVEKLALKSRVEELQEEMQELLDQHTLVGLLYPENEPPAMILDMAEEKRKEKIQIEKEMSKLPELPFGAGPISQRLEQVLQNMNVCRQAFHGGAFVGNHVHTSLQPKNVDAITECLEEVVESTCPDDVALKKEAGAVAGKYNQLFHLFGACHRGMNSGTFLDEAAITKLEENIRDYMAYFRQHFPTETVTPKQHILENHTIPWMKQWRASFGMMGEQGGESVHCQLNTIMRDLRGYHDDVKLYLQSVRSQWVKSSPPVYHQRTEELQSKRK